MPETVIGGRYALEYLLGRGGMSEVWCAHDRELERRVALKLLAPDADTARFEREARAVASLAHPNITQVYDFGHHGGRPYMVLEYVPGGTLEDRLREADAKPLPDEETAAVAAGIAAGLAHAHARGVVHRDLKPANVLFDDEGRPKIADFGIARLAAGEGTLTEAGTVLGTAAYISPEQAAGEPATAASDVYSFGVLLYRMLTGRLPFESNDPLELVMMNRDTPPPPVTAFRDDPPGRLESTASAALEKDPRARPRDGGALLAALGVAGPAAATTALAAEDRTQVLPAAGAVAGGTQATRVVPGAAPPGPPPPGPPARSRLALLLAAVAILLAAGAAVAYALTRPSSASPTRTGPLASTSIPTSSTTASAGSTTESATTEATTTGGSTTEQTTTHETTQRQTTEQTQQTTTQRQTTSQQTTTAPLPPPPTTGLPTSTTETTTTAIDTTTTTGGSPGGGPPGGGPPGRSGTTTGP
jgi:eukaryotic-like serine/threonine-protein kinase